MVGFGNDGAYQQQGIASLAVANVTSDARGNAGAWQTRTGTVRNFFPYTRGMRYEISNEMGAAWGVSRAVDALYDGANTRFIQRDISISNIQFTSEDFMLGDRLSADGNTWWTVGQLNRPENPEAQNGTGGITMLYMESGANPPSASWSGNFTMYTRRVGNGVYADFTPAGTCSATVTVGGMTETDITLKDDIDYTKIGTTGFSINGKYAFVAGLFDERVGVTIPGAAGATGPQVWRYNPAGNDYGYAGPVDDPAAGSTVNPGGAELPADNILHNPGRTNEVIRRFLTHFRWYQPNMGIDANGNISHGFMERLPYDHHELVASFYPRAHIVRGTFNDYQDGGEGDALASEGALITAKYLADKFGYAQTPAGVSARPEDLVTWNYRFVKSGEPHGNDTVQYQREAQYMAWYFQGKPVSLGVLNHLHTDPFLIDVLVPGGSNSYERHYGGFSVMMGWPWSAPYYPK
jgi:hypothetical protein